MNASTRLPPVAAAYLQETLLETAAPLVLSFGADWRLAGASGDATRYGIDLAEAPALLRDVLVGCATDEPLVLPQLELPGGHAVHLHLVPDGALNHVILLDAAPEVRRVRAIQQPAYDSALLSREKSAALRRLKRVRQELELQRDQLRDANTLKEALIGTLSHEFRTPLTSILGYAHLLGTDRYSAEGRAGAVAAIRRAATHLHALVENLLVFARADATPPAPRRETIDLAALVEDLRAMFAPVAEATRSQVLIELAGEHANAITDPLRLRQILINLVGNALRYAPGEVLVQIAADARGIALRVVDHGPGLPERVRAHLYEPMAGGHARGAGLGLAIVKRLVEGLGGSIAVESAPGAGTSWRVQLPTAAASVDESVPDASARAHGLGRVAVLADDDPDVRALIALMLADLGWRVVEASDANSAVDAVLAEGAALALIDVQLPGLSGNTAAYRLRVRDYRGHIVMLSAHDGVEAAAAARAAGADLYLTKPLDPARLAHALASLA